MLNDDILSVLQGRPIINGMPPLDDFVIIDAKFEPKFDVGQAEIDVLVPDWRDFGIPDPLDLTGFGF